MFALADKDFLSGLNNEQFCKAKIKMNSACYTVQAAEVVLYFMSDFKYLGLNVKEINQFSIKLYVVHKKNGF